MMTEFTNSKLRLTRYTNVVCAVALCFSAARADSASDEREQALIESYDQNLCTTAQQFIVNSDSSPDKPFPISVQTGVGDGFHNIQMDVDADGGTVSIATTQATTSIKGEEFVTHVSCKMVNRERVNNVLGLTLNGPERTCRDVNARTYQVALDSLSNEERQAFEAQGKPLRFVEDYVASSGGEWLPSSVDDYIEDVDDGKSSYLEIQAPSVQVPWNASERQFFQGTHHCKLITAAAMQRWMVDGGLNNENSLFPRSRPPCDAPTSMTSQVGSCRFYFAPSQSTFCKDYSGAEWTIAAAQEECGKRHATREAVLAAENKYEGAGGVFSRSSCRQRGDAEPIAGTCVFNCKAADETLWHTLKLKDAVADTSMASGACDLYIEADADSD